MDDCFALDEPKTETRKKERSGGRQRDLCQGDAGVNHQPHAFRKILEIVFLNTLRDILDSLLGTLD
jgi:hypothetical protein